MPVEEAEANLCFHFARSGENLQESHGATQAIWL